MPPATASDLLAAGQARLEQHGIDSARLDSEVLLAHVLDLERSALLQKMTTGGFLEIGPDPARAYEALVARRCRHEPVAYLVGCREFYSLDLVVGPGVLIPRPETELLVDKALERLPSPRPAGYRVVDAGTGSGAIAIALASRRRDLDLTAVDLSGDALEIAARNVSRHGFGGRVHLVRGDLLEPLREDFDMVVSNPPYIGLVERDSLMPDVREHEPAEALFAGPDGMEAIERLVPRAARLLVQGGWLVMEIARQVATPVRRLLDEGPWEAIDIHEDLGGEPRVVTARRKEKR